ncbi:MAG: NCS2 family permease [Bacteroidaceae bacterium]|nr:NCS2 family permease [Bacteroidaceae bacterium]
MLLQRLFGFDPSKHSIRTEITAGLTSFLTMAYILAVNPNIFSELADKGMDTGAVFTATVIASVIGTLIMAIYAKLPFGLAPGMGLNAFFVYTVCLGMGYSWQFALTAILLEGILFIILSITNIRALIVNSIPHQMKSAISVGIGLFITSLGMKNCGLVVPDESTIIALGDFSSAPTLLCVIGLILISILLVYKVKGGLLIGILATALIGIPMGVTHLSGIIGMPPDVSPLCFQFEWHNILTTDMILVVFTFLFFDLFDTIGTLIGVMSSAGMVKKDGTIPRLNEALLADAIATTAGACVGASTTTTYVESASGVGAGGRTGLTSASIALFFVISLFFAPLFLSIPSAATSPVLIIIGLMMFSNVKDLTFDDYTISIPCFITIIVMVMAGSISDGILQGIIMYVFLNAIARKWERLNPTIVILAIIFLLRYFLIDFLVSAL